jgi:toxin ParE1/3/4
MRFTPTARRQLLEALDFLSDRNPAAAAAFLDKVERRLRGLPGFPESGRQVPEFPDLPFREVLVPPYRLFYRVRDGQLWAVGVWHDAQLPTEPPTV